MSDVTAVPPTNPTPIATPWGEIAINSDFLNCDDDRQSYESSQIRLSSPYGHLQLEFFGDRPIDGPLTLSAAIWAGAERFLTPHGEPIHHQGKRIGVFAKTQLDLSTSAPLTDSLCVSLYDSEARASKSSRSFLNLLQAPHNDPEFSAVIGAWFAQNLNDGAARDPHYAARIAAFILKAELDNAEQIVKQTEESLAKANADHDAIATELNRYTTLETQ